MYPKATDVFNSFKMFGLSNEKPILALKNQVAAKKKGNTTISALIIYRLWVQLAWSNHIVTLKSKYNKCQPCNDFGPA